MEVDAVISSNQAQSISNFLNQPNSEVEFRFGSFTARGFHSGVSRRVYDRFVSHFDDLLSRNRVSFLESYEVDTIGSQGLRRRQLADGQVLWVRKTKDPRFGEEAREYPFFIAYSRETPLENPPQNFVYNLTRNKSRRSYFIQIFFRLDVTLVQESTIKPQETQTKYEVELEILRPDFPFPALDGLVKLLLQILLDSDYTYSESQRRKILATVNKVLKGRQGAGVSPQVLMQARNLKLDDLVYGGIVGGEISYSATHKADGIRKLLVVSAQPGCRGLWLILPPFEVTLVLPYQEIIHSLAGYILDGEYIPEESRRPRADLLGNVYNPRHWYVAFDCLSRPRLGKTNGFDPSVQVENLNDRLAACQIVADAFKAPQLFINTKQFLNFNTPESFFQTMKTLFSEQANLSYKQDGFIITAKNLPYNTESDKFPLIERKLTKIPDNCKWKPPSQLTIDLIIVWKAQSNGQRRLTVESSVPGDGSRPFTGSRDYPLLEIITENEAIPNFDLLPSGTVVEFLATAQSTLEAVRIRDNKQTANRTEVAQDVWYDAHHPLTADILSGDTFVLVRRYHNRIKRELLDSLPEGASILDLGSGRGGDLAKWRKFSRVLAVEPNAENRAEFESRLKNRPNNKVSLLPYAAQQTQAITDYVQSHGGPVDAVTMFLSLTFFWQSQEILQAVLETIRSNLKPGGVVLFLTIDGNAVQQVFAPRQGIALRELKLGQNSLSYSENPPRLTIHLPGTMVENQTEPLVFLDDLLPSFSLEVFRADKEKLLTPEESIFTNLYTYGRAFPLPAPLPAPRAAMAQSEIPPLALPAIDEIEEITLLEQTWFRNIYRVSCLNMGSAIFHALLKAFYPDYRNDPSIAGRVALVSYIRRDIAYSSLPANYSTLYSGAWLALGLVDPSFTLAALEDLFNSRRVIEESFYEFIGQVLGQNIYLFDLEDLSRPFLVTRGNSSNVLLLRNGENIDLLGLLSEEGQLETFFSQDSPIIAALSKMSLPLN